ncbi:hypothetical protein CC86DRAFT_20435 [Ophiobolus disseminans]|uniref:Uncharacterized protein n=1 Tax=Ophiobolus disseminans TaxID=1469910 RepID=A0A6A7A0B2_9PLEO|nr:hypothetical protein CC86DRAFT_20435 [Ophiobolus disseminans]
MVARAAPHGTDGHSAGRAVQPDSCRETDLQGPEPVVWRTPTEDQLPLRTMFGCGLRKSFPLNAHMALGITYTSIFLLSLAITDP